MPCMPIKNGIVCLGNEPVAVNHNGKTYRFEWHPACGWMAVNKDGSGRQSYVPRAVWEKLTKEHEPPTRR